MPASTQTTQRALHRFFSYRIVSVFRSRPLSGLGFEYFSVEPTKNELRQLSIGLLAVFAAAPTVVVPACNSHRIRVKGGYEVPTAIIKIIGRITTRGFSL